MRKRQESAIEVCLDSSEVHDFMDKHEVYHRRNKIGFCGGPQ